MTDAATVLERMTEEIFNQPEPSSRAAAIAELCAPDIRFIDPEGETNGADAFSAKIDALLAQGDPSFRFHSASPYREVAELAIHDWVLGASAQQAVLAGTDVALVRDGRIVSLYTLLN